MWEQMRMNISDARTRTRQLWKNLIRGPLKLFRSPLSKPAPPPPRFNLKKIYIFIYWHKVQTSTLVPFRGQNQRTEETSKGIRFFLPLIYHDCFRCFFILLYFFLDWGRASSHRNVHESRCLPAVVLETPEQTGFDVRTSRRTIPNLMHIFDPDFSFFFSTKPYFLQMFECFSFIRVELSDIKNRQGQRTF